MKASVEITVINNKHPYKKYHYSDKQVWFTNGDVVFGKFLLGVKMVMFSPVGNEITIGTSSVDIDEIGNYLYNYRVAQGWEG